MDAAGSHERDRVRRPMRSLPTLSPTHAAHWRNRIPRAPLDGRRMSARQEDSTVVRWTARLERHWRRLSYTGAIIGIAIIITWLGVWLIRQNDGIGLLLTSIATLLTLVAFRHMGELSEAQKLSLRTDLAQADRRNRELDRFRHLAGILLAGADLDGLVKEVALAAADLLEAESGAVTLVVEEGRFLRVKAATGPLEAATGTLIPIEASLLGAAVTQDAPLVSDDMDADPRSYLPKITATSLKTSAVVPLR